MARQPRDSDRAGRRAGAVSLALAGAAGALLRRRPGRDRGAFLPPALPGRHERFESARAGLLSLYSSAEVDGRPLLLVHSVNAAASAYEVRPLYLRCARTRPVYALELPGFGRSERTRRRYTPRLMVEAIHAAAGEVRRRHANTRLDALALSLSCAYLARTALERGDDYRSLAFISPTGFDTRLSGQGPPDGNRGRDWLRHVLDRPPLGPALFSALTSRPSIRFFLEKTFGSRDIDEGLLAYDHATAHQPGAEHAPYCFISGHLFPTDTTRLYEDLRLPVWMVHGERGDFVDYRFTPRVADRLNWRVLAVPTGAFPHFERPEAVAAAYDAFLADITPSSARDGAT